MRYLVETWFEDADSPVASQWELAYDGSSFHEAYIACQRATVEGVKKVRTTMERE